MVESKRTLLAIALAAWTLGVCDARAPPCRGSSSASQVLVQTNTWCETMSQVSTQGSFSECCPAVGGDDMRRMLRGLDASPSCRTFSTDKAYCDESVSPGCTALLSAKDELVINLEIPSVSEAGSCCDTCACFGDPSCVSFTGKRDEWVVCDGRTSACKVSRSTCLEQIDHAGNQCKWLKGTNKWDGWSVSGSPCQPDWSTSGHPTMTMYETDEFALVLTLGERGVIESVSITGTQGSFFLSAEACFDSDPRVSSTPAGAWTSLSADSLPSEWTVSTPNDVEIVWTAMDADAGIVAEIVCAKAHERKRIDVRRLVEMNPYRPAEVKGFCTSGTIEQKSGSTQMTSEIWNKCLEQNAPDLLVMCKKLVNSACSQDSVDSFAMYWCENADLARVGETVDTCKSKLTSGSDQERRKVWTEMVCKMNQLNLEQCKTDLSQFGWEAFLTTYSDGLVDQGNPQSTCSSSWEDYMGHVASDCEHGIRVEYLKEGEWVNAFFVPHTKPPCNNEIKVNAEDFPELFLYPLRFEQCGLSASCVVQNACSPSSGFSASVAYSTSDCPTPAPTLMPTQSPTKVCEDVIEPGEPLSSPLSYFGSKLVGQMNLFINEPVCGQGDQGIFQVGCYNSFLQAKMKDCTTELVFELATTSNLHTQCIPPPSMALPTEEYIDITMKEEEGSFVVMYGTEIACQVPIEGSIVGVEDVCVQQGVPGTAPADACVTASFQARKPFEECVVEDEGQDFCEEQEELQPLGTCQGACPPPSVLIPIGEPVEHCKSILIAKPYCDLSQPDQASKCSQLEQAGATFTVKLDVLDEDIESCCKSCHCFGDPKCIAFDGSEDDWLLCDARDEQCVVQEDLCSNEIDHMGNACKWNPAIADILENRADIGAIGSPCQPDWNVSGKAHMIMYSRDDFRAKLGVGNRGIIEELELSVTGGVFTLNPDNCFGADWRDAWTATPGSSDLESSLRITVQDGPGPDQRSMEIIDPATSIFLRAVCILRVSKDGKHRDARLNIHNLIEPSNELDAASISSVGGFCPQANAVIDKGQSTVSRAQAIHAECQQSMQSVQLLCRELYFDGCTPSDLAKGVEEWCKTANVFVGESGRVQKCIDEINPTDGDLVKVGRRWSEMYCKSVEQLRPAGITKKMWLTQCVTRLETDGFSQVIGDLGLGTFGNTASTSGNELCGQDETAYSKRTEDDACMPGISVQYQANGGDWVEELFIPFAYQPCAGQLEISAKNHYNLFVHPVRFHQCALNMKECPMDVACLPSFDFNVSYAFHHSSSLCP